MRADRPELRTLEDLRGRSVAIMSRTAFAGWQIPASEMVRKGLDPEAFFSEIRVSGYPMTRIVQEVKSGEVDVGFVATCLLERMARGGQIDQKDFRVIGEHADRLVACRHSTELYPNWFFSIKPSVPTSVARTLTATLLDVPAAPDGTQWTISNDNRRLFEVFRVLQVPYGNPDDFGRFVRRILPWVVGAGGVLLILLLNTLLLARLASPPRTRAREGHGRKASRRARRPAERRPDREPDARERRGPSFEHGRARTQAAPHRHRQLCRQPAKTPEPRRSSTRDAARLHHRDRGLGDACRRHHRPRAQLRTGAHTLACRPVDLSDLVKTAVARWRRHSAHRVPCTLDLEPGLTVEADRLEIELAVLNIVKNAAAAVKDQPDAAIEVTLKADGAYARLCIADNGPELSDEEIARLGDIGYTTTAGGLGLGIAIVHSLLEAHGGSLAYRRRTDLGGRGLVCTVRLPLSSAPEDRTAALSRRRIPPLCFQLPRFPCGIRQNA